MKQAFKINISQNQVQDLQQRLAATRWPDEIAGTGWNYGTDLHYIQSLCDDWESKFDWRKQEEFLNGFDQFKTNIQGLNIHFLHIKGKGKAPQPLLLTHGFPDSFVRMLKLIPLLTEERQGQSFDLVVPSIPGFGFSESAREPGMNPEKIAGIFHELMTRELGYPGYFAHGGDWGSSITEQLAFLFPEQLLGIHLTDLPYHHLLGTPPENMTGSEKKYLQAGQKWQMTEGGYAMVQSTKPQSIAYGLNDSPAGLAAWIIEKFYTWTDCNGDLDSVYSRDELLTNLSIYWFTQTIASAMRIYYESAHKPMRNAGLKIDVPTGVAIFPKDLVPAPRDFAERIYNLQHWSEMPRGGHFAALEEPEMLAADIRSFIAGVRARPARKAQSKEPVA